MYEGRGGPPAGVEPQPDIITVSRDTRPGVEPSLIILFKSSYRHQQDLWKQEPLYVLFLLGQDACMCLCQSVTVSLKNDYTIPLCQNCTTLYGKKYE